MNDKKSPAKGSSQNKDKTVSKGRHEYHCTICSHPDREHIEQAFINWSNTTKLAARYSVSRDAIYRHAHALGLMDKRRRNVRAALEKIIEKAGDVEVNAAAVVSAVSALARINSQGNWIERTETVSLNALFNGMTADELETYARDGKLPHWFREITGATKPEGPGGENER
ncbi:MAG: hypothetical protein ACM34E_15775 [Acidobacteriota bacterium]